jgi:hypothetical protein
VADLISLALSLRRRLVVSAADLRLHAQRRSLAIEKGGQRERFRGLAASAGERYELIRRLHRPEFSVPDWRQHVQVLEQEFSPAPPFDFLRNPRILFTMFILTGGARSARNSQSWRQDPLRRGSRNCSRRST